MCDGIEPFASGLLAVDGDNEIYWETSGNPEGIAALYLHGGPGSGLGTGGYRRRFDPDYWLIVGLDQRGCGRSRPLATEALDDLDSNTTATQIADLEHLREHLGIERWLLVGGSWGTTLAIAYAQAHPQNVIGLVLAAVTTTSVDEVSWITETVGAVFPREWDQFAASADRRSDESLVAAYSRLLRDADPRVRADAARAWCAWEDTHVSLSPGYQPNPRYEDASFRELFATLVTHYWSHAGFCEPPLLDQMGLIAHIPAVLIHGRLDVSGPLITPWKLHQAWPASELIVVDEGHGGDQMVRRLEEAIAGFATA